LRLSVRDSLRVLDDRNRATEFMDRILGSQRAVVDSATFMLLADSLRSLMTASRESRESQAGYAIMSEDVDVLLSKLSPALERPIVRLPGGPLLLGDALESLRFYTFALHSLEPRRFAVELSAVFRGMVEGELMAREGIRRGLASRAEVQSDLEMWTDSWRAHMLLVRVAAGAVPAEPPAAGSIPADSAATGSGADRVARFIASLAARNRVELNYSALRSIDILPANMVTRRFIGFGGGMLAAPSLPPLWEWVRVWRESHAALP
jgi:hypothetical protein